MFLVTAVALLASTSEARLNGRRQLAADEKFALDIINNPPTVLFIADDGVPASAYPLQYCQGDCDIDEDCAEGLVCFQRANGAAPTCKFDPDSNVTLASSTDVCTFPVLKFVGENPIAADTGTTEETEQEDPITESELPLKVCEGDCDDDSQCAEGLVCFKRISKIDPVPGCAGLEAFNEVNDRMTDFCVKEGYKGILDQLNMLTEAPTVAPTPEEYWGTLTIAGDNGEPASAFPLQVCQADCDVDSDCAEGLYCLQRRSVDAPVSFYCEGTTVDDEDYCLPINEPINEILVTGNATTTMMNMTTADDMDAITMDETPEESAVFGDTTDAIDTINAMGEDGPDMGVDAPDEEGLDGEEGPAVSILRGSN